MTTEQNDVIDTQLLEVTLTIKGWKGIKRSPQHEKAIRKACGATRRVGHVDLYLVSASAIKSISTIAGAWRNRFLALTLPWSHSTRAVGVGQLKKLNNEHRHYRGLYTAAVDTFCDNWSGLVEEAKAELNGEFDPAHYPPVEEVRAKFTAEYDYFAVRRGEHINSSPLGAVIDLLEEAEERLDHRNRDRVVDAFNDFNQRIVKPITHFKDRMVTYGEAPNPKAGKSKRAKETITVGKFHVDTIEKLRDLVEILPGLNFYDDPRITEVLDDIRDKLTGTGSAEDYTQELRDDAALRAKKAKEADAILDKMAAF